MTKLTLAPYQQKGARWLACRRRAMLADDMGLGKTAQAIAGALLARLSRVVIICPASVASQWVREIDRWSEGKQAAILVKSTKPIDMPTDGKWVVCPYTRADALDRYHHIDALIIDEAHYLKNPSAKRTKRIWRHLRKMSHRVWLLTGTPIPNRPCEVAHILPVLAPSEFPSQRDFLSRYCAPSKIWTGRQYVIKFDGASNTDELASLLDSSGVMLRRLTEDVLKDLPKIRRYHIPLDVSRASMADIETLETAIGATKRQQIMDAIANGEPCPGLPEMSAIRAALGAAKAPAAAEYMADMIEGSCQKIVAFVCHHATADILAASLKRRGIGAYVADGRANADNRKKTVDAWSAHAGASVLIASISAMGTGVDGLQKAASVGVFVESDWTPANNRQAEARIRRIGQEASGVSIYYLSAPHGIDERIAAVLAEKTDTVSAILSDRRDAPELPHGRPTIPADTVADVLADTGYRLAAPHREAIASMVLRLVASEDWPDCHRDTVVDAACVGAMTDGEARLASMVVTAKGIRTTAQEATAMRHAMRQ